jgi:hypothetical protein
MSATQNAPIIVVQKAWDDEATKQELVDYVTVENKKEVRRAVRLLILFLLMMAREVLSIF